MTVIGDYDKNRLKFDTFKNNSEDKGINKHSSISKLFHSTFKFDFIDHNGKKRSTFLNRKSAIKWLKLNGVQVNPKTSNAGLRQKIVDLVASHQISVKTSSQALPKKDVLPKSTDIRSNQEKLLRQLGFSDGDTSINYRGVQCEFRSSMNSHEIIIHARDSNETYSPSKENTTGSKFKLYLDENQVYLKEISGPDELTVDVFPLSGLTLKEIAQKVATRNGLSFYTLANHLGIKPGEITVETRGKAEYSFKVIEGSMDAVAVDYEEGGIKRSFRLDVDENEKVQIKTLDARKGIEMQGTIHLASSSTSAVIDTLIKPLLLPESSNKEILWKKIVCTGAPGWEGVVLGKFEDVDCIIKPSKSSDAIVFYFNFPFPDKVKLYLDGNNVYLKQVGEGGETTIDTFLLKDFTPNEVIKSVIKYHLITFNPPKPDNVSFLPQNRPKTIVHRMLGSVYWKKKDYQVKAKEMGLYPLNKKLKEFPPEKVQAFFDCFLVQKALGDNPDLTIETLIQNVKKSKKEGMLPVLSFAGMKQVVTEFINSDKANTEDKKMFELFQSRIQEQFDFYFLNTPKLENSINHTPDKTEAIGLKLAEHLLNKVDNPKYKEIGLFVKGGWHSDGSPGAGGHHVNVEVKKEGDKYIFYVANAGAGVRFHRKIYYSEDGVLTKDFDHGFPIKAFEIDEKGAQEILKSILIFEATPQPKDASTRFYQIFDQAVIVEDYAIPSKGLQSIGNCGVRNQQECLFYICQRLGKVGTANRFLESLDHFLLNAAKHYPALKEDLEAKGGKLPIRPLIKGETGLILQESGPRPHRYVFPSTKRHKTNFFIGAIGNRVPSTKSTKQPLIIRDAEGKYYIKLNKNTPDIDQIFLKRKNKTIKKSEEIIELEKGDIIVFNNNSPELVVL